MVSLPGRSKPRERIRKDPTQEQIQQLIVLWEKVVKPRVEAKIRGYSAEPLTKNTDVVTVGLGVLTEVDNAMVAEIVLNTVPADKQPHVDKKAGTGVAVAKV